MYIIARKNYIIAIRITPTSSARLENYGIKLTKKCKN